MAMKQHPMATADELFRTRVTWIHEDGKAKTRYEGPYQKYGTAHSRITFWISFFERKDPTVVVDGEVQVCQPKWEICDRPKKNK